MTPKTTQPPGKHGLTQFIDELHKDYVKWYERSLTRVSIIYGLLQLVAIMSGFGSAILAAYSDQTAFATWTKLLLVAIPALGSLAAGLLAQFRVYDLLRLREEGRIAFAELVERGRRESARAMTKGECATIREQLALETFRIERDQSMRFFCLAKESISPKTEDGNVRPNATLT